MSDHIGRSFDGHPLEDACPCPQEACGLVDISRTDPACAQHPLHAGKTIRQSHPAERCPVTAPTSPKPPTPVDPTVSKDPATTLDNGAVDAGLRTALEELADEWDDWPGGYGEELRALLAVHPTSPPVDADVIRKFIVAEFEFDDEIATEQAQRLARDLLAAHPAPETDEVCGNCLGHGVENCAAHPAPVSDTRREDVARVRALALRTADSLDAIGDPVIEAWDGEQFTTADLRALAVLPAPPVVDEAEIEAAAITEARVRFRRQRMNVGTSQDREEQAFREGAVFAARLRGATRG